MPRASIVIPTHNRSAMLERCLRSVLEGTLRDIEVVVSDDGSSDGTATLLSAWSARDPRVRHLPSPQSGPAAARNRGWRAATGSVVAFIDDDCIAEPGWAASLLEGLEAHPEWAGAEGRTLPEGSSTSFFVHTIDAGAGAHLTCNLALRKSALERVGGLDETFPFAACEDLDLCLRVIKDVGPIGFRDTARVRHALVPVDLRYYFRRLKFDPSYLVLFQRHPDCFADAVAMLPGLKRLGKYAAEHPTPSAVLGYLTAFRLARAAFALRDGHGVRDRLAGCAIYLACAALTPLKGLSAR